MSETSPLVSIIIVNYNTPVLTTALIKSVAEVTVGVEYDITVVDNGSEPSRVFVPGPGGPAVEVINLKQNLGFARAVNLAAAGKRSPFLLFANSDCRLLANVIPEMIVYLKDNDDCAACSPCLLHENGAVHSSIRRFPTYSNVWRARGSILRRDEGYTLSADSARKKVEAMSATFMMVKRELFEQVGGFDERYFMYVEDTDLCKKFHDAGKYVVYLGGLKVVHHWGASTRLHPWRMRLEHHRSVRKYFLKHFPDRKMANLFLSLQLAVNCILVSLKLLFVRRQR